jgi:hypothetical protein
VDNGENPKKQPKLQSGTVTSIRVHANIPSNVTSGTCMSLRFLLNLQGNPQLNSFLRNLDMAESLHLQVTEMKETNECHQIDDENPKPQNQAPPE